MHDLKVDETKWEVLCDSLLANNADYSQVLQIKKLQFILFGVNAAGHECQQRGRRSGTVPTYHESGSGTVSNYQSAEMLSEIINL